MSSCLKLLTALLLLGTLAGCAYPGAGFGSMATDSLQDPPIYHTPGE